MTDAPLVSVMMIAYNDVRWIKAAIDSVRAQTYTNWELIVQDDHSSDGTWELAEKLSECDSRIRVYRNAQNMKTPNNRAEAVQNCKGKYVAHLDSNDMLFPVALATMVYAMEKDPKLAYAYSDRATLVNGEITGYVATKTFKGPLHQFGWMALGMYRKDVYDTLPGYNRALTEGCEDGDLLMQIIEKHPAVRVPAVLYMHRMHDNHTSSKNHTCGKCPDQTVCNFYRVWTESAGYDPITFTPRAATKPDGQ